ncbi:MAG TPA: hypothetical protein VKZ75_07525 [Cyclobacteriaceae bacterium]|nr:hypothetical protein [Cyclobacteriaceae bacterium]
MEKNNVLLLGLWMMVILGLVMVYLGGLHGPNVMWPPIVTGIGFFVIAWVFAVLRK